MTDRERLIGIVKSSLIKHIDKSCCLAENIVDDLLAENVTTLPVAFSDNRRERMIELLGGYYEETGINIVHYFTDEESEMLADYILADGWIRPPCNVGDTVYFLDLRNLIIRNLEVIEIKLTSPKAMLLNLSDGYLHGASDYGISLFRTKEEAEKALAERSLSNEQNS